VAKDPRVHLVGFGPSQSTVGANRAGREAVGALVRGEQDPYGGRPAAYGRTVADAASEAEKRQNRSDGT
jgi:hypothetical protein